MANSDSNTKVEQKSNIETPKILDIAPSRASYGPSGVSIWIKLAVQVTRFEHFDTFEHIVNSVRVHKSSSVEILSSKWYTNPQTICKILEMHL